MDIPLCNLKASYQANQTAIDIAINRVIDNSSYILGKEVQSFEEEFAVYLGARHCIGTSSCTAALHLALKALEVGPGDDVIIPVNTVTANVEAVLLTGGNPIFADVDDEGLLRDVPITDRTKVVIAIHMHGIPCDMNFIMSCAQKHGFKVIEDCAQATGAYYNDRRVGTIGDIGVFSFFPSKILGCFGDGGAVVTDNKEWENNIRSWRNHGRRPGQKHLHHDIGFNYRLDGLQAGILRAKLPEVDYFINQRCQVAKWYEKYLGKAMTKPNRKDHVYYVYSILNDERDGLISTLRNERIGVGVHYPVPLHMQPAYEYLGYKEGDFPVAEARAEKMISLPMYPELTKDEVRYIAEKVYEFNGE